MSGQNGWKDPVVFYGTSDNDDITGAPDSENIFHMEQGGEDTIHGGHAGNDYYMGATLSPGDRIYGGGFVHLDGDYSADLTISREILVDGGGIITGAAGAYHLVLADDLVQPGGQGDFLAEGSVYVDASADMDSDYIFDLVSGRGSTVLGGAGDDVIWCYSADGKIPSKAQFDGGGGNDELLLVSGESGPLKVKLSGAMMQDIEHLMLRTSDVQIKVMDDGVVAAGQTFLIDDSQVVEGTQIDFDGHREKDGGFELHGTGVSGQRFVGGGGVDRTFGIDTVTGGHGADQIVAPSYVIYTSVADSTRAAPDEIFGLAYEVRIDLHRIDADKKTAGDQAFHLVSALSGHAGELALSYDAASGRTTIMGDVNGDGRADLEILVDGDHHDYTHFVF